MLVIIVSYDVSIQSSSDIKKLLDCFSIILCRGKTLKNSEIKTKESSNAVCLHMLKPSFYLKKITDLKTTNGK